MPVWCFINNPCLCKDREQVKIFCRATNDSVRVNNMISATGDVIDISPRGKSKILRSNTLGTRILVLYRIKVCGLQEGEIFCLFGNQILGGV